ncbi:hypothetical protein [Bradyrhizobium sp. AZCC 2230]|uniref:hypothetical protein n=1 Tax=Bradyrhizobium sp. AZCC 2230 TaxID=3117021 RepID=UPI002FF2DF7D
MRIADNVIVHDPETSLGKINADRLRAHGWPEEVVQQQQQREQSSQVSPTPGANSTSD